MARFDNRNLMGVAAAVILVLSGVAIWRQFSSGTPGAFGNTRIYLCMETGKSFPHQIQIGEIEPIESPYTGKKTGWPTEECWCHGRENPVYVVLKSKMNLEGETRCPDCNDLVIPHNVEKYKKTEAGARYADVRDDER
jgi:hypothetical protein